ncbi:MAG: hypothetical protein COA82_11515 [Alkaliphilus sp.]|nr:MAG: hypothetical protein COA82_11515 [Alkaliphilus sp.]
MKTKNKQVIVIICIVLLLVLGSIYGDQIREIIMTNFEKEDSLTIIYSNLITVEITDQEKINIMKRQLEALSSPQNFLREKISDEDKVKLEIRINDRRYIITEEMLVNIHKTEKKRKDSELEIFQIYRFACSIIGCIQQLEIKEDAHRKTSAQVYFEDYGISYDFSEERAEMLISELKEASTIGHIWMFVSYPAVEVKLLDGLLNVRYLNDRIATVRLNGSFLMRVELPKKLTFSYLKDEYYEHFVREDFMKAQCITITYGVTNFQLDSEVVGADTIDSFLRVLLPMGEAVQKPVNIDQYNKITIEVKIDADTIQVIEIYENDFWYYNGQFYFKDDLFKMFYGRMTAG